MVMSQLRDGSSQRINFRPWRILAGETMIGCSRSGSCSEHWLVRTLSFFWYDLGGPSSISTRITLEQWERSQLMQGDARLPFDAGRYLEDISYCTVPYAT